MVNSYDEDLYMDDSDNMCYTISASRKEEAFLICSIANISKQLKKGSIVKVLRVPLKNENIKDNVWYMGVPCEITHTTRNAVLFTIQGTNNKFWCPISVLGFIMGEKERFYIRHWVKMDIYKDYK